MNRMSIMAPPGWASSSLQGGLMSAQRPCLPSHAWPKLFNTRYEEAAATYSPSLLRRAV